MTNPNNSDDGGSLEKINKAIQLVCRRSIGVLDTNFLCQSIGILNPPTPLTVREDSSIRDALAVLREARAGCLLVLSAKGSLVGIFSERDCLLKVVPQFEQMVDRGISEVMTREPVTQSIDGTIGFALTLMSEGGFRHIPIVDESGVPTGLLSVKEVMDYIVAKFIDDALAFDPNAP